MPSKVCAAPGCTTLTTASRCPLHAHDLDLRDNRRRHTKQKAHGRDTAQWRRTAELRKTIDSYRCQHCGTTSHLTVHLNPAMNGDHTTATVDDCLTLCRACHGRTDGHRSKGGPTPLEHPATRPAVTHSRTDSPIGGAA